MRRSIPRPDRAPGSSIRGGHAARASAGPCEGCGLRLDHARPGQWPVEDPGRQRACMKTTTGDGSTLACGEGRPFPRHGRGPDAGEARRSTLDGSTVRPSFRDLRDRGPARPAGLDHGEILQRAADWPESTLCSPSRPVPSTDGWCTRAGVPGTSYEANDVGTRISITSAGFAAIVATIPSLSNVLSLCCREIGVKGKGPRPVSLVEYAANRAGR